MNRTLPTRRPTPLAGQPAILRLLCVPRALCVNSDPFSPCPAFCFHFLALLPSLFSISSPLFHFPYPLSPLFATLTQTAGVCTNNSQNGTFRILLEWNISPCNLILRASPALPASSRYIFLVSPQRPTVQHPNLPTSFDLSPVFSYDSALFCTCQNRNSCVFMQFHTLCAKHPGWGTASKILFLPSVFSPAAFGTYPDPVGVSTSTLQTFNVPTIRWQASSRRGQTWRTLGVA